MIPWIMSMAYLQKGKPMAYHMTDGDRNVVQNLRGQFGEQLAQWGDPEIAEAYREFCISDQYGTNDEKFVAFMNDWQEK